MLEKLVMAFVQDPKRNHALCSEFLASFRFGSFIFRGYIAKMDIILEGIGV